MFVIMVKNEFIFCLINKGLHSEDIYLKRETLFLLSNIAAKAEEGAEFIIQNGELFNFLINDLSQGISDIFVE